MENSEFKIFLKELSLHVEIMYHRVVNGIDILMKHQHEELCYAFKHALGKTNDKYPRRTKVEEPIKEAHFEEILDTFFKKRSCYNFDYSLFDFVATEGAGKDAIKNCTQSLKADTGKDFEHVLTGLLEMKTRPDTILKRFVYLAAAAHFYSEMGKGDSCSYIDITHTLKIDRAVAVILEDIAIARETGKNERANTAKTAHSNKNKAKKAKNAEELVEQTLEKLIQRKKDCKDLTKLAEQIETEIKLEVGHDDPRVRKTKAIENYLRKSRSWSASNFYDEYQELIQ